MAQFIETFRFIDTNVDSSLPVILLLGILLFLLLFIVAALRRVKKRREAVLVVGLGNAGKTVLFEQLRDHLFCATHTSMKPNEAKVHLSEKKKNKEVHLVDIPGHERLRWQLKDYLPIARGIIFLVDSVDFNAQANEVAEFLYDIFSDKQMQAQKLPLLIACNKTDLYTAVGKEIIQQRLELEINNLKKTHKSMPDQSGEARIQLGREGEDFRMSHLKNPVSLVECSAKEGKISEVEEFIATIK